MSICLSTMAAAQSNTCPAPTKGPSCEDVIKACDKVIKEKNKALDLADLALTNCGNRNADLNVKLQEAEDSRNAWYHNPWLLIPFGVAAGVVLGQTVLFK